MLIIIVIILLHLYKFCLFVVFREVSALAMHMKELEALEVITQQSMFVSLVKQQLDFSRCHPAQEYPVNNPTQTLLKVCTYMYIHRECQL